MAGRNLRWLGQPGLHFALVSLIVLLFLPAATWAQGETTSAILGEIRDSSDAVVPGASVTITNRETGLKRTSITDGAGRFNFPQLQPGTYTVQVSAPGFEPQKAGFVSSSLGQKQTVDFTLKVARSNEAVEVSSEAPLINPESANTSTTLNAPALENLPNLLDAHAKHPFSAGFYTRFGSAARGFQAVLYIPPVALPH